MHQQKWFVILVLVLVVKVGPCPTLFAQAIDPERSAQARAAWDAAFIARSIEDSRNQLFFAGRAKERARDERVRELAAQMEQDHIGMLFTMEQLASSGTRSGRESLSPTDTVYQQEAALNERLLRVSGLIFDTVWVSGLLPLRQAWYAELSRAKEEAMNPRLQAAINEALSKTRRHVSQLGTLQRHLRNLIRQLQREEEAKQEERGRRNR